MANKIKSSTTFLCPTLNRAVQKSKQTAVGTAAQKQLNRIEMKKVIKFLLVVAVVAMSSSLFAQTNTMLDVVYCKNGSVIKGVIIEQIPNQSIKIQTSDGNIFVYNVEDVEKITKEQVAVKSNENTSIQNEDASCFKGSQDAEIYYQNKGAYRGGIWACTLLGSPLIGLIPTIAAVTSDLSLTQLNVQDERLANSPEYMQCYKETAKSKRNKASWTAWGISTGVSVVGILLLNAIAAGL